MKRSFFAFILLCLAMAAASPVSAKEPDPSTVTWRDLWSALKTEGAGVDSAEMLRALAKRDGKISATEHYIKGYTKLEGESRFLALWLSQHLGVRSRMQAAVPLLESEDADVREAAKEFLLRIQKYVYDWREEYVEYLRQHHPNRPPDEFLILIMDRRPLAALEILAKAYRGEVGPDISDQEIAGVARHTLKYHLWMIEEAPSALVEEQTHLQAARQTLTTLLNLNRWWANVFVAAALKRYEQLRTLELKRRLLTIDDPLVQQHLDWAEEEDQVKGPLEAGDGDVREVSDRGDREESAEEKKP